MGRLQKRLGYKSRARYNYTMKKHYTISYWLDEDNEELHLSILDGNKTVYTEDILSEFEDEEDIKLTCLEIAQARGYFPALFEDDAVRYGRQGGKKSSANMTKEQRQDRARKAVAAREEKKKDSNNYN